MYLVCRHRASTSPETGARRTPRQSLRWDWTNLRWKTARGCVLHAKSLLRTDRPRRFMPGQLVPALSLLVMVKEGITALKEPEKCPVLPSLSMSKLTSHSDSQSSDTPLGQAERWRLGLSEGTGAGPRPHGGRGLRGARRHAQRRARRGASLSSRTSDARGRGSVQHTARTTLRPPSANHEPSFRLSPKVFPPRSLSSAAALFPAGG